MRQSGGLRVKRVHFLSSDHIPSAGHSRCSRGQFLAVHREVEGANLSPAGLEAFRELLRPWDM